MSATRSMAGTGYRSLGSSEQVVGDAKSWIRAHLRLAAAADFVCGAAAGVLATELRFGDVSHLALGYLAFGCVLPVVWLTALSLAGAYDCRFIGTGSEEFRRVVSAAMCLTAGLAMVSYAGKIEFARGYLALAMPSLMALDLGARYALRKRLHRLRRTGACVRRVVAAGHTAAVARLITTLRRDQYHGLSIVAACLAEAPWAPEVAGVPVVGGLEDAAAAVRHLGADMVAVLACPEMDGHRLRELAWELEKTGTDLCVAPALLDVAGPRTTIRPVAGLPLLHVDHPQLDGVKWLVKAGFDRLAAALALILLSPLLLALAVAITLDDGGPVLFRQRRVGKDGRMFTLHKFRSMVVGAESQRAELASLNETDGLLFKMRRDPRVTRVGAWMRRWSLDELPQLLDIARGDMSLVGPRPALPEEAAGYGHHMRRRLVVRPGLTGLWQVSGRSTLPWEEAERLDLRYVENWSLVLDLQILWKTGWAVIHGTGAY